jgi:hypothetical protein
VYGRTGIRIFPHEQTKASGVVKYDELAVQVVWDLSKQLEGLIEPTLRISLDGDPFREQSEISEGELLSLMEKYWLVSGTGAYELPLWD